MRRDFSVADAMVLLADVSGCSLEKDPQVSRTYTTAKSLALHRRKECKAGNVAPQESPEYGVGLNNTGALNRWFRDMNQVANHSAQTMEPFKTSNHSPTPNHPTHRASRLQDNYGDRMYMGYGHLGGAVYTVTSSGGARQHLLPQQRAPEHHPGPAPGGVLPDQRLAEGD